MIVAAMVRTSSARDEEPKLVLQQRGALCSQGGVLYPWLRSLILTAWLVRRSFHEVCSKQGSTTNLA